MSTNTPQKKQRRARKPGARGPQKGKSNGQKSQKPRKQVNRPRRRRRGVRGRNSIAHNGQLDTSSHYMGGNVIRNTKKFSKPEPFEGDELIATLNGSIAFTTTGFVLNPGNPTTFPWFSRIASLYERYKFTMLEFYFQHDVSQFNSQGAAGLVLLSTLYDASSSAPVNKQQIEASDPRVICMPNENSVLSLSPQGMHPTGTPKFVRGAALPGATDIKTYDAGTLYASTQGMAAGTEVGELHVRYKGFTYDRILDSSAAAAPHNFVVTQLQSIAVASPSSAVPTVVPLATVVSNGLAVVNAAGTITPIAGNYLVDIDLNMQGIGTSITLCQIDIQKNGVTIAAPMNISPGAIASAYVHESGYISMNGVDTLTFVTTQTYVGAGTYDAIARIVAI